MFKECTGIRSISFGINILDTPYLESIVAVFDVGAAEIRFSQCIR
jgi:hypothetical protein